MASLDIKIYIDVTSWRRQWHPTPVLLPGKSHGQRSLVGCRTWSRKESGTTERLHFHFFLSCIGEGNGNPLQCSCLENPRDGGAWWATIYGVAQSRTLLKRLSSSSSRCYFLSVININKIISAHTQKSLITQGNLLFLWTFRDGILLMPPNIGKKGFEALCSVMALLCSYTYVLIDYILLLPVLISII